MTRIFKYLAIFIVGIAGLLATAVAVINLIPSDKYKDLISSGVKSATGRDLVIEGDVDIKLLSTFSVKASGIKFANADWSSRSQMASIGALEAEVALLPLLKGILDVTLLIDAPELLLETHNSGQGNWVFKELVETNVEEVAKAVKTVEQVKESVEEEQSVAGRPLRLYIRKIDISRTRVVYFDGNSGDQMTIEKKKLIIEPVDGKLTIDLEAKYNDIPLALSGNFGNADSFMDNQATTVSLAGHVGDIQLAVQGTTGPITPTFNLDVTIKLNADTVAAISPLAGQGLPDIGPLAVSARLIGKDGKYAVKDLLASLDDKIVTAEIKASIADLVAMHRLTFEAAFSTDQLTKTCELFGLKVEPSASDSPKEAVAAKGNAEKSTVKQVQPTIEVQESKAEGTSRITQTMSIKGVPADAVLDADSLDQIVKNTQTEQPATGSVKNKANVTAKDEDPGTRDIKTDLSSRNVQVKIAATVVDVLKFSGINADINLSVDSLALLNDLAQQQLPASAPVTLEGKIIGKGGLKSPVSIDTVLKSDGVLLSVKGTIEELLTAGGIELKLNAEAESMQQLGKLTGIEFQSTESMKLEGKFIAGNNNYQLSDLHFQVVPLDVKGNAAFQQPAEPGDRPRVSAALHIGELDLSKREKAKLDAATENMETTQKQEEKVVAEDKGNKKKVFTSDPLPWEPLRNLDADIAVTMETLKTMQLSLEQVTARVILDNGLLTLKPLQAKVGNGTFGGTASLDARNSPAVLAVDIKMSDATFLNFGGKINFLVDLKGSGDSVAEIMAGLNGQVHFDVREATLKQSFMTGFGSGLLGSLNPFAKDKENTELICAIALFDIKNGIADANRTIAAQMTDVTWFGSGEVNLITEEIDFGMSPKARKGLGGVGGLATLAHLGGTLAEPRVEFDPTDVAVKYGKYTAAVASGGLTLVADMLFSRIEANTDVCTSILEKLDKIQAADDNAEELTEKPSEKETERKVDGKIKGKAKKKEKAKSKEKFLLDSSNSYL